VNIFGVGGAELILIIFIMLVVAGPKRMITWAYIMGTYIGKLQNMWKEVAEALQKEMDSAGVDVQVPKNIPTRQNLNTWVQDTAKNVSNPVMNPINETLREVDQSIKSPLNNNTSENSSSETAKADKPQTNVPNMGSWTDAVARVKSQQKEQTDAVTQHPSSEA